MASLLDNPINKIQTGYSNFVEVVPPCLCLLKSTRRFRYTVEPGTGLRRLQTQRLESDNLVVPGVEPGLTGEEELTGE